ncbi:winged helix-turn-helix transcriptional regulator [Megalodesulfovibrio gigas]|uniref:winged helix-turn-helix transcriptional regulator n=1 Tax=Megalodesulfovibrio gigas TaxID=879 RepID=UPI000404AF67|nr:helix-turn-helix domain-containing protein [Megalodesulfovibrio gigas]
MAAPCCEKELNGRRYRCFFELTLDVIGGKWKPIILYHLGICGVQRFSDLRRSMPGVTERMLSRQLKELATDGLVHREVYREVPPRVEYWLTDQGKTLMPILLALRDWGAEFERLSLERDGRGGTFNAPHYEQAALPAMADAACGRAARKPAGGVEEEREELARAEELSV